MKLASEEKRQFPRIKFKVPVRYQIRGKSDYDNSLTDNISLGGLSFTNDRFISPSTNLTLELRILAQLFTPLAKVSWISPLAHSNRYRLGVEFLDVPLQKKEYLSDFINMQLSIH